MKRAKKKYGSGPSMAVGPVWQAPQESFFNDTILEFMWCWIKTTQQNCDIIDFGVVLTFVLFFGPAFGVASFGFISLTIICICGCKTAIKLVGGNRKKANRLGETSKKKVWQWTKYGRLLKKVF